MTVRPFYVIPECDVADPRVREWIAVRPFTPEIEAAIAALTDRQRYALLRLAVDPDRPRQRTVAAEVGTTDVREAMITGMRHVEYAIGHRLIWPNEDHARWKLGLVRWSLGLEWSDDLTGHPGERRSRGECDESDLAALRSWQAGAWWRDHRMRLGFLRPPRDVVPWKPATYATRPTDYLSD